MTNDIKRDIISAGTAFISVPAYSYLAPKKWPRPNMLVGLGTVVGVYFLTSWIYGKVSSS